MSDSEDEITLSALAATDDYDEDDMPLAQLKAQTNKKRSRGKPKYTEDSDADDDDDGFADSDNDDDDFADLGSSKKKKKKTKPTSAKKKVKVKSETKKRKSTGGTSSTSTKKPRGVQSESSTRFVKILAPIKQLELAMKSHKWWDDEQLSEGQRWHTLEHNGVMFPPAYVPHGAPLLKYAGEKVLLTPEQEEVAMFYAGMPLDGPQLGDPPTAIVFNKNFFKDFKKVLGRDHVIQKFDKIDWTKMRAQVTKERAAKKEMTKEEKEKVKLRDEKEKLKYTFALVDGNLQRVGNIMVEPPSLFRGRGAHPKTGTLKLRVMPEQITLNIGENSPIPPCPIPGHSWGRIVHKHDVTWLAYWNENVMGSHKYVWLASSSMFKGQADLAKYEKARKLKKMIGKIRGDYERNLTSKDETVRQIATAMWVIDRLALRVGNEKDDDAADTVGCCSLRVEHIKLNEETHELTLDFLGKDSMRHFSTYDLEGAYAQTGIKVYKNFKKFTSRKKGGDDVFNHINPSVLNDHLKTLMPGLSAKVFRTYNASFTLESQLPALMKPGTTIQEKVLAYNAANREVAILCNHQKTVTKAVAANLEKLSDVFDQAKVELEQLGKMLKKVKKGKSVPLKSDTDNKERKLAERHLFSKQPSVDQVNKRIVQWKEKIHKQKLNLKNRNDNKDVALGTSKINYMDPRISVAWTKRNECPIEKVFPTALRDKFPWAMSVKMDFKW